jgi:hypothetical protein
MCFADAAHYSANYQHRNQQSSRPATAFSCAADALLRDMRLPRLTTARTANNAVNDAAGGGPPDRPAEEEPQATKKATKTSTTATAIATATATTLLPRAAAYDPAMRRCQSARPRESGGDHADHEFASIQRTRSHSQKTAYGRTRELPIPAPGSSCSDYGGRRSLPTRSGNNAVAEESELVRMYDYATWNMYERIVSARRKRLAQIDLQQRREAEDEDRVGADPAAPSSADPRAAATSDAVAVPSAKREERQQQQWPALQTLNKNLSHDENSTLATADETDRASTTSSWSRADSPIVHHPEHGLPSLRRLGFPSSSLMGCAYPNNEGRCVSTTNNNEEDSFIFELDM